MPFLSFCVHKKTPFQLCWDHMTGFWDAVSNICRYRTDHKTLFKCPHCHYCFSNLRDHVFQIIASQDGRNLNYHTTALTIYVRDLVNNMAHTKRCQGTNYIGEGRFYRQNEEWCKIALNGETFLLLALMRKMKEISSRTHGECYIENTTWLENFSLKEACCHQREHCRNIPT